MKPMIFKYDDVFDLFDRQGYIYTVRSRPKKIGSKVWIRRSRTGEKEFDARIKMSKEIPFEDLSYFLYRYVESSGLDSVEAWIEKIKENLGGEEPEFVYLHLVKRIYPDMDKKTGPEGSNQ